MFTYYKVAVGCVGNFPDQTTPFHSRWFVLCTQYRITTYVYPFYD